MMQMAEKQRPLRGNGKFVAATSMNQQIGMMILYHSSMFVLNITSLTKTVNTRNDKHCTLASYLMVK